MAWQLIPGSSKAVWTIEPEQIWKKPRRAGISGFMRLKNEAEFLDEAIATHIDGLDELVIVHNDCTDETPEICQRWARELPEKISVTEYKPSVVPMGTPDSLTVDPRSPHCIANYYNFALSRTNCKIVIKIDGDHIAVAPRFRRICDRVRRELQSDERYPIYGLNITTDRGEIVIYNFYDYSPGFTDDASVRCGPAPFTGGDHAFYHVDSRCWHTVHPIEGYEVMNLAHKSQFAAAALTYCFFHCKGMKADRGTGSWGLAFSGSTHRRARWAENVRTIRPWCTATIEAMRRHNPMYFRGASVYPELREAFPHIPVRTAIEEPMPRVQIRERVAGLWYRLSYP